VSNPFYSLVPKDRAKNLAFRRDLVKLGCSSKAGARELWMMCARDLLFYTNTFCWIYEPRTPKVEPFITYPFQDDALKTIDASIGNNDLVIEKSRDMGASWMCVTVCEWRWHFHEMQTFLLLSRKEDLVDKTDDPKSLYWKIDFLHKYQPKWLLPNMDRQKMHLKNEDNGSTIDGDSTSAETSTGDRRTAVFFDEFSKVAEGHKMLTASRDVTKCRIFNFTPQGAGNAAYDIAHSPEFKKLRLHWSVHPEKTVGLYTDAMTGKPRSIWYDNECKRAAHPMEIRQELDIDYLGSSYQFFDQNSLDLHKKQFCRPAVNVGEATFDAEKWKFIEFVRSTSGRLHLWLPIDVNGAVPKGSYVFGVDTAMGTGSSNSVISIGNSTLKEKVGEFVTPHLAPDKFALMAVVLAQMFRGTNGEDAFMVWEDNGPGNMFGRRVIELGFRNFYYRKNEKTLVKNRTDKPGWYKTEESGIALLSDYRAAIASGDFVNHSAESIEECRQYIYNPNGGVIHAKAANMLDPSGAKANHGDRVIGDALLNLGMKECAVVVESQPKVAPRGSMAWRRERDLDEAMAAKAGTGW
jgi:hypothetical protein